MPSRIKKLYDAVEQHRRLDPSVSRTAKLLTAGVPKMAQKLGEEAVEVAIDSVRGDNPAVVLESVDLIYHLVALWAALGIRPAEIWAEMDRREAALGLAEKLPKSGGTA